MDRRAGLVLAVGMVLLGVVSLAAVPLSRASTARDAVLVVDTYEDGLDDGTGDCSLREAVQAANTRLPVDGCPAGGEETTIRLAAGTYLLALAGAMDDANASGDLDVLADRVRIEGLGAAQTAIDGAGLDRVLHIHETASVEIHGVTIRGGRTPGYPAEDLDKAGGGVFNAGRLTLVECAVTGNRASDGWHAGDDGGRGGGIYSAGALDLDRTTVSGNTAGGGGGSDLFGDPGGQGGAGGGVYSVGWLVLVEAEIRDNAAGPGGIGIMGGSGGPGGGLYSSGTLSTMASAVTGNVAGGGGNGWGAGGIGGHGGGIYSTGPATMTHSIVSDNAAGSGGGGPAGYGGLGGSGGGVYNLDRVALMSTAVDRNRTGQGGGGDYARAGGAGGGIYNGGKLGTMTMTGCSVGGNQTGNGGYAGWGYSGNNGGPGGGIYNAARLTITGSTIHGNRTGDGGQDPGGEGAYGGAGGGLFSRGWLSLTLSTVSGNATGLGTGLEGRDGPGGGISADGAMLEGVTLSGNAAGEPGGGGEGGGLYAYKGETRLRSTIIAGNRDGDGDGDCQATYGVLRSEGYNLVEVVGTCPFTGTADLVGLDPVLGPLADNGGLPTGSGIAPGTHALLMGSPALDQGSCGGILVDQRGWTRPLDLSGVENAGDGCDVGAYEYYPGHRLHLPVVVRRYPGCYDLAGGVWIEEGACCVVGTVGQTLDLDVAFGAAGPNGPAIEMRVRSRPAGGCFSVAEMAAAEWQPFAREGQIPATIYAPGEVQFYVGVQYRDRVGCLSPVVCDNILVEGLPPPTPTPWLPSKPTPTKPPPPPKPTLTPTPTRDPSSSG